MKHNRILSLFTALVCAFVCTAALTVAASATAVYVSATGNDANDGLAEATAVATLAKAQTLAAADASVDTIYVVGKITLPADINLGVAGREISILGCTDDAALDFNSRRATSVGNVVIDDLNVTIGSKSFASFRTKSFSLTFGPGVTGTNFGATNRSISQTMDDTINASFTEPTVFSYNIPFNSNAANNRLYELTPTSRTSAGNTTFNGWLRYDIGSGSRINYLYGGRGNVAGTHSMNGIMEINAAAGSQIEMLNMNRFGGSAAATVADMVSNGLRDFHLNGNVDKLYLAGSQYRAASASSTGVTVWTFSSTSKIGSSGGVVNFRQNGIENETDVTHVLIFNNNNTYYSYYHDLSASWTVPNEYVFNVDNTGTVEAYMSKLPTADDLECTFGGIELISTYNHAIIDAGTADEQVVYIGGLTDGKYPIANIAEGTHTVTFEDRPIPVTSAFTSALVSKAGYVAANETAAERTYAILASVQLADWVDVDDIESIGFYGYTADSETAKVTLATTAAIKTELAGEDLRFYAAVDDIPTAATEVILKPFAVISGTTYVGDAASYVPETIGATTYYGTQTDVDDYFAD